LNILRGKKMYPEEFKRFAYFVISLVFGTPVLAAFIVILIELIKGAIRDFLKNIKKEK